MDPLQLHFGLGNNIYIDSLTVNWPSKDYNQNTPKVSKYIGPIDANQSLRIVEDIGFVGNKGDINNDNVVDVLDVIIAVNHVLSGEVPDPHLLWAADMNYDNILNILDVVRILNVILG